MNFISSDTNVWIDFMTISRLSLPFMLPYTYIMYKESIDSELLAPLNFKQELLNAGLKPVDITLDEFRLAESWGHIYPKLSIPDRIALAIAKNRKITLLSGDKALRNAASLEGVKVLGTIGLLDELYNNNCIFLDEYEYCLLELLKHNGKTVRLPSTELQKD